MTRARCLRPFRGISRSNSSGTVTGAEKVSLAPVSDRSRSVQSKVMYRLLNTILPRIRLRTRTDKRRSEAGRGCDGRVVFGGLSTERHDPWAAPHRSQQIGAWRSRVEGGQIERAPQEMQCLGFIMSRRPSREWAPEWRWAMTGAFPASCTD